MNVILQALGLLTTLPVRPSWREHDLPGRAMAAYPMVGAIIGALLGLLAFALVRSPLASNAPLLIPVLILAAWIGLTGGLHLDGWSDCCDAFFAPVSRERRMEIMHDPRLGSFGAAGLVVMLLAKTAAIQGILSTASGAEPASLWPLVIAPVLGRWGVVIAALFPLARPQGMGARFRRGLGLQQILLASVTAALLSAVLGWAGLALWVVAAAGVLGMAGLALNRLGGLTGDVYGATVEICETLVLIGACLLGL